MNILEYSNYQKFLSDKVKNSSVRGHQAQLALAAKCQRPYMSQILAGKAHLTPEQAHRLTNYWKFSPLEARFFITMVNMNRAGTKDLADFYRSELDSLRRDAEKLSSRYREPKLELELAAIYYSTWVYSAIHMLVTVQKFQTIQALSSRLELSIRSTEQAVRILANLGLVSVSKGLVSTKISSVHLSKESPMNAINHLNWRQRSVQKLTEADQEGIHYTGIYSLSIDDYAKLRKLLLSLIDKTRDITKASPEEEVICFNCDLFKI